MFFNTLADSRPPFEHDERRHGGERQVDRLRDLAFRHLEDVGCLCADIQLHAGLRQGVEQGEASHLTPGRVSCGNCHLNGGQRELALPLVGSAAMFPEYNRRAGRDFTRYMMPYLDPGVLTDEEAQQVAAFITSQPRPVYPYKDQDYLTEPRPVDAVQYDR